MGEKIKNISIIQFKSSSIEVELNEASIIGGSRYIHIQNESIRLSITESEFIQMSLAVNRAYKHLEFIKGRILI